MVNVVNGFLALPLIMQDIFVRVDLPLDRQGQELCLDHPSFRNRFSLNVLWMAMQMTSV